jgi:hypothetical protein
MEIRSVRKNIALESGGFMLAEGASMATSLGVVAIFDKVMPQAIMDKATNVIAKVVIEPYLDTIEKTLAKCHLEECQTDETKTREERACRLARGLLVFGSAYLTSLGVKYLARKSVNKYNGIDTHKPLSPDATFMQRVISHIPMVGSTRDANMIMLADEAVHIGSLVYLNTTASKFTDEHINKTAGTLEKLGMSHKKAKEVASMLWVWEAPNALGMMAGGIAIAGKHTKGWAMPNQAKHTIMDVISGDAKVYVPAKG